MLVLNTPYLDARYLIPVKLAIGLRWYGVVIGYEDEAGSPAKFGSELTIAVAIRLMEEKGQAIEGRQIGGGFQLLDASL
jgi:hypothetical protein